MDEDIDEMGKFIDWLIPALIVVLLLFVSSYVWAGDTELCYQREGGGSITLTIEPCPVTNNSAFHRVFYTEPNGNIGDGCYMASHGVVLVIWKDHPMTAFPADKFISCATL